MLMRLQCKKGLGLNNPIKIFQIKFWNAILLNNKEFVFKSKTFDVEILKITKNKVNKHLLY